MDRELAAALAGELPAAANVAADDAKPAVLPCPTEGRGATFFLPDGGQLTVLLMPQGSMEGLDLTAGGGGAQASAPTNEGDQVLVVSTPEEPGGSIPYESDLSSFAATIAGNV